MKRIILFVVVVCALVAVSGDAWGDTIYDNGSYLTAGRHSDITSLQIAADNFTLTESASISGIEFWGIYLWTSPTSADNFTLVFYESASGLPDNDNVVATFSLGDLTATVAEADGCVWGGDIYRYEASITDTQFGAGTYWVSVYNDTSADKDKASTSAGWLWSETDRTPQYKAYQTVPDTTWYSYTGTKDYAFNLTGTWGSTPVPEPTTLALLSLGVAGLGWHRRRRRAKAA